MEIIININLIFYKFMKLPYFNNFWGVYIFLLF